MEFITKYSESVKIGTKETINGPSMTEPDNAMSIPEIIARFTRGQGLAVPVRPWEAGSASEDGQPVQDADIEVFLNGPKPAPQQPAPQQPAPQQPAPQQPAPQQPAPQQPAPQQPAPQQPAPQQPQAPSPSPAPAQ